MSKLGKLKDHHVEQLADMFRLLGDPTRLRLMAVLCNSPAAASVAAAMAGISPQLASHHLRLLRAARLVRAERRGREIHYAVADEHVRHMLADMAEHVTEPHHHQHAPAGEAEEEKV